MGTGLHNRRTDPCYATQRCAPWKHEENPDVREEAVGGLPAAHEQLMDCGAQIFTARKCFLNSMTIRCDPTRARTRDGARPTPTSHARSLPPPIDVGILNSESPKPRSAGQEHQNPSSCAASPRCSALPTLAASLINALRKAGSSNPDTPAGSC